ncbi:MAG: hypothetical protein WCK15_15515 [Pirellula sp.]
MYPTAPLALFGLLFFGPLLFLLMPPRRAAIAVVLLGTLFLPNNGYAVQVLRSFDKGTSTALAMFLGLLLFDGAKLVSYRPHWIDIPMLLWCFCPVASSISNDLGFYDGLADSMVNVTKFGLPYTIGRVYIKSREGVRDLVVGMVTAGLVYVPFCLLEIFKGPFFHHNLYGFYPHNYWEQLKPGGWRPSVFFMHGLWLCGFMAYSAICAVCLWRGRSVARICGIKIHWVVVAIVGTLLKSNSNGAVAIFGIASAVLVSGRYRRLACAVLILIPIVYTSLRITGLWSGGNIVDFYGGKTGNAGYSLNVRLDLENRIVARAMQRPVFGWGGYGRAFLPIVTDDARGTWTEAIWTKAIGERGLVGLWSWMLSGLLPAWLALRFVERRRYLAFEDGAVLALILLPPVQTIYGLMVLDFSPVNPFCSGALAGFVAAYQPSLSTLEAEALEADIGYDEMGEDEMVGDAATAESVEHA